MNRNDFVAPSGTLVDVVCDWGKDVAFVPDPLPPKWQWDHDLWPLLADAREQLGTLNGIGRTLPHPGLLLQPLKRHEALTSSALEGTYATAEDLLAAGMKDKTPSAPGEPRNASQEVLAYERSLTLGQELLETLPICQRVIRRMHEVLLEGFVRSDPNRGTIRTWQVAIGTGSRFLPPPPDRVPELLANLDTYINVPNEEASLDPLVRCFVTHYQFETIHPFGDGNGRIGRALLALMIARSHDHSAPWLYMSAFFERHKDEYIDSLYRVSTQSDWRGWIELCLRGVVAQARDAIARCSRFLELRSEFATRIEKPTSRTAPILDHLFETPLVTVASIESLCSVTYNTARTDIQLLIDADILHEREGNYPKQYAAVELIEVAHGDRP